MHGFPALASLVIAVALVFAPVGAHALPDRTSATLDALVEASGASGSAFDRALALMAAAEGAVGVKATPVDVPVYDTPAEALQAVLDATGADARDAARAAEETLAAFVAYHHAGSDLDLGGIFGARASLVAAARDLRDAVAAHPAAAQAPALVIPTVLSIDLGSEPNTYTADFALLVDAGGDDVYLNNAGGSSASTYCSVGRPAALLDFGGNDTYGPTKRLCGINGGANLGAGFLLDAAGHDRYFAAGYGGNGGARSGGAGFLLDLEGNDVYEGGDTGTNGGANVGSGFLLDIAGNDTYRARGNGTNGAGHGTGAGFLLDAEGNDTYSAKNRGVNGGAFNAATGFLADLSGDDRYEAGKEGVNGGVSGSSLSGSPALTYGFGLLYDGDGRDVYVDEENASGVDRSAPMKGLAGFQIDHARPKRPESL